MGWAVGNDWPLESGSVAGPEKTKSEGQAFLEMDRALTKLIEDCGPEQIIFPEYHNTTNADAAKQSLGLRAIVLRRCAVLKIPCLSVEEMRYRKIMGVNLKRELTPFEQEDYQRRLSKRKPGTRGTTKPKRDMKARVATVLNDLGLRPKDNDEADAILILIAHGKVKP